MPTGAIAATYTSPLPTNELMKTIACPNSNMAVDLLVDCEGSTQVRHPPDLRVLVHHGAHLGVGVHHGLQDLGLGHQALHSLLHTGLLQHLQHGPHV